MNILPGPSIVPVADYNELGVSIERFFSATPSPQDWALVVMLNFTMIVIFVVTGRIEKRLKELESTKEEVNERS